jgi:hypothetical protein
MNAYDIKQSFSKERSLLLLARNLAVEYVQKHAANIGQLLANGLFSMYCVALQEFNA